MHRQVGTIALCWALVQATAGCGMEEPTGGANRPEVFPVTGKVTYDGQPLEGAHVSFIPNGDQPAAFGTTDVEGKFSLRTFEEDDGAAAGSYVVTIIKQTKPQIDNSKVTDIAAPPPLVEVKSLIPEKYADPMQSGLSAEVKATGDQTFDFALQK